MKNKFLKGIALLMLATTTLVSCSTDQQDTTTTTNVREFETKSNVTNFDNLLRRLYGSSYTVENPIQVRDINDTYTLKHVTTPAGIEGYIIISGSDKVYVQHDRTRKSLTNYTNDTGIAEGVYDVSRDKYYLDHGFNPIFVHDPGAPAPVVYGKRYSYGSCAQGPNGDWFAGVYVTRRFLFISGNTKALQDDAGHNVTTPCTGDPKTPVPYGA